MALCVGLERDMMSSDALPSYPRECLLPQRVVLNSTWRFMSFVKVTRDLYVARCNGHCSVLVDLQY